MNRSSIHNFLAVTTFLLSVPSILTDSVVSDTSNGNKIKEETKEPRMWGEWGGYQRCDAVCGKGLSFRYRECLLNHCSGKSCEAITCDGPPCGEGLTRGAGNGTWGQWGEFKACNIDCGVGHKYRGCKKPSRRPNTIRVCSLDHSGNSSTLEIQHGDLQFCCASQKGYRECRSNRCSGYDYEYVECTSNKCEGGWSNWALSACSKPCGYGTRHKVRQCVLPSGAALEREKVCNGSPHTTVTCNVQTCPLYKGRKCYDPSDPQGYRGDVNTPKQGKKCFFWNHRDSQFRPWNYSSSGLSRNYCRNPDGNPGGPWCFINQKRTKRSFCDVEICPSKEDVYWNGWSDWSDCSVSCDEGRRHRVRNCHGGSIDQGGCFGDFVETRACILIHCGQPQTETTSLSKTTTPVTTTPVTTTPVTTTLEPTPECGHPDVDISGPQPNASRTRIVGGDEVIHGSIPWQVSLQLNHVINMRMCGGSIINRNWILSAAHCFEPGKTFANYKGIVGSYSFKNLEEEEKTVLFKALYIHQGYNESTLENDIALLKMTEPLNFTSYIKPICLPEASDTDNFTVDKMLLVTGWGSLLGGLTPSFPDGLQQVYVPVVSREKCDKSYTSFAPLPQGTICAGYLKTGGLDSCSGDSGGPLVDVDTFVQIGVVSWGRGCAKVNSPGVYTYVPHYVPWIENIMENDN